MKRLTEGATAVRAAPAEFSVDETMKSAGHTKCNVKSAGQTECTVKSASPAGSHISALEENSDPLNYRIYGSVRTRNLRQLEADTPNPPELIMIITYVLCNQQESVCLHFFIL